MAVTNGPDALGQFARQRRRWSRGLVEAFKQHPRLLLKPRLSLLFIWWNVMFLPLDVVYTLVFIPGIIAALFGYYHIVGIMTLLVLPLALRAEERRGGKEWVRTCRTRGSLDKKNKKNKNKKKK